MKKGSLKMGGRKKTRILFAKPGLDGHDVGVKVVVRALMDAGFEVTYTGLKKTPEDIVGRVVECRPDVLGLSILSGSHVPICRKVADLLREKRVNDLVWVVGGNIPREDHPVLKQLGVHAIFAVGSSIHEIVDFINRQVDGKRHAQKNETVS